MTHNKPHRAYIVSMRTDEIFLDSDYANMLLEFTLTKMLVLNLETVPKDILKTSEDVQDNEYETHNILS